MQSFRRLRTGKSAARRRKIALGARIVLYGITLPLIALTLWMGVSAGVPQAILVGVACLGGLALLLRRPLPEGRAEVPLLTLCAQGIQIEPAARPGQKVPLLFLWSELDRIALHRPLRGGPYLRLAVTPAAAMAQGLRPATWGATALTRWTAPAIIIPADLFDCPAARLMDTIGACAAEQGLLASIQNRLDGGMCLSLTEGPDAPGRPMAEAAV